MQNVPQEKNFEGEPCSAGPIEEEEDFSSPFKEENEEYSFYLFIQDLDHYIQDKKWAPHIFKNLTEEARIALRNLVTLEDMQQNIYE